MLAIFIGVLIAIGQETISIFFLTGFSQPRLNYSSFEEIFETEEKGPVLAFKNSYTASGATTETLFEKYEET